MLKISLNCLVIFAVVNFVFASDYSKSDTEKLVKPKKYKANKNTAVGSLSKIITQVINLPKMSYGAKFRTPCKTGNRCGKVIKRLMVPKLAQLENTIMGIMKEVGKNPPGARLPDKYTKTEPIKLLFDQNYKEDACIDNVEACLKEDKRRKRILKKLFFKKYNAMREELIGEDACIDNVEACLKEDKRRKRILKKLFFKKYNAMREELIGYGGRRLWGGEGNLFY